MLANILPDISHILRLSFLPLFYPYVRYLGLIQIYRLNPTVRTFHPITTLPGTYSIPEPLIRNQGSSQVKSSYGAASDSLCVAAGEYWSSKLYSQKSSAKLYSENPPTDEFLTVGIYLQNNTKLVLHLSNPRL